MHKGDKGRVVNINESNLIHVLSTLGEIKGNDSTSPIVVRNCNGRIRVLNNQDVAQKLAILSWCTRFTSHSDTRASVLAILVGGAQIGVVIYVGSVKDTRNVSKTARRCQAKPKVHPLVFHIVSSLQWIAARRRSKVHLDQLAIRNLLHVATVMNNSSTLTLSRNASKGSVDLLVNLRAKS